ncbi:FtsQ-type POTRA domain-containing protein [Ruminococcaceae bacterium OttesenSCG-928-O06]|nr:FtsQ-type POTRA domain-containing protein [Ruminococcaceae bacterium OttesenSCG-928-O06]
MAKKKPGAADAAPKKKRKKGARQEDSPPPQQPAAPSAQARGSRGVPPLDAFDHVKRLPPPNLPGPGRQTVQFPGPEEEAPKQKRKKGGQGAEQQPGQEPPKRKTPQKPVNPVRRRRRRRIAAALFLVVLVGLGTWLTVSLLFKIEKFEMEGESPYTVEEIAAAFGPAVGDAMYGFTANTAEERIEEALPYIESVSVRRRLPSTILFRVQVAQEKYYLPWENVFVVLSSQRKVLRTTAEEPQNLTRIDGLSGLAVEVGRPLGITQAALDAATASLPADASQSTSASATGLGPLPPVSVGEDVSATTADGSSDASGATTDDSDGSLPQSRDTSSDTGGDASQPAGPVPVAATAAESFEVLDVLLTQLDASSLTEIDWVNVADPLELSFRWQGRITVKLGPKGGIEEKMATVAMFLTDPDQGLNTAERGTVDMSYYLSTGRFYYAPE